MLVGCGKVVRQPEAQGTAPGLLKVCQAQLIKETAAFSEDFPPERGLTCTRGMRKRGRKSHSEKTNRTKEQRVPFQEEITVIFFPGKGEMWVKIILSCRALESIILERAPGK